jgi:hypothetical protein
MLSMVCVYLNFHDVSMLQLIFHTVAVDIVHRGFDLNRTHPFVPLMLTAKPLHRGHLSFFMAHGHTCDCGLVHRPHMQE